MYIGGDYVFNLFNFAGLNISMIGAFLYAFINFTEDNSNSNNRKSMLVREKVTTIKKKSELKE